jgi:hypothetical protein
VLCTVRLLAGLVLDTITLGYRFTKIDKMHAAMVTVVAAKAKPSRCSQASQTAASTAMTASSSITLRKKALLAVTCVQTMNPITKAAVTGATARASRRDRRCMTPVVFRHKNVAPCSRQARTRVTPVKIPYGCSRSQNDPV